MNGRNLYVSAFDLKRLKDLLDTGMATLGRDRNDLASLADELKRATVVAPREVPPKVVTMNTRLRLLDLDTKKPFEMTVVFPDDANVDVGKVSVTSPVGTAVLGYSEGDTVEWAVPAGTRRLLIEAVIYQPEAAGDFTL